MKAYILYENEDWMPPLRRALTDAGVPFDEWFINEGHFDLQEEPPEGVFINRISPSSHTRGHTASVAQARQLLAWLERHGRRVINGLQAFELEMSKVQQQAALEEAGLCTPTTRAVAGGSDALLAAGEDFPVPFLTKHNRGGKGLGVQLFRSYDAFARHVRSGRFVAPPDQITLLQQFIEPADPFITRCEFVGGRFLYAITSDTSDGFELCPADACRSDEERCTIDGDASLFALREDVPGDLLARYARFLEHEHIDVAGIEFIEDAEGRCWTYDVNGTTNYAPEVEARHGLSGMAALARMVARALPLGANVTA